MKFAEHLCAHITPEWRKQYINYEEMKAMLYLSVEEAPSAESVDMEILHRHFANFDEQFFHYCDKELKKINTFYSEKLAEATRKFANLVSELQDLTDHTRRQRRKESDIKKYIPGTRKVQDLKLAFSEFYLSLILLQNYQTLNHTGFRKILKKHDKLLSTDVGSKWHREHVETSHFYTNKDIDKLINDTESSFTSELESGDRQKAMKRLRVPPLGEKQSPWTTFKVGLFSGSFIVLIIAVVLSAVFYAPYSNSKSDSDLNMFKASGLEHLNIALRLYRGPLLIIEFLFLMGVNIYGWRSSGVNHVLIFELDPRNHLSEQHLMEMAAIFGVVWALSILSFLYSSSLSIPPFVNPLALSVIMMAFVVNPFKVFRHNARFWFLKVLGRMIAAPFFHVGFADFWLADQLNSLVSALLDFQFLVCFYYMNGDWLNVEDNPACLDKSYIMRSIVNCIPAWIRFAQCLRRYHDTREAFPHLVNAGKYSTTFFVVIFSTLRNYYNDNGLPSTSNTFFFLWIAASVVSSLYAYIWDIRMDWGLFDKSAGENRFLRDEVVYSSNYFYYFAIIEDLILRFSWAISYYFTSTGIMGVDLMTSILSPLEVFRRFVWNFFRLENEHLNNCGKFRAVRDISVAPIDSSDQLLILAMMDEEDGVTKRRKTKKTVFKRRDGDKTKLLLNDDSLFNIKTSLPNTSFQLPI